MQILDSHPRTYSVPSSDDGSLDEDDMYQSSKPKVSVDLAKEISDISHLETHNSHTERVVPRHDARTCATSGQVSINETQSIGASQANPIDLEHGQARQYCIDIESDSDDEGPEVLPMMPNSAPENLPSQKVIPRPLQVEQKSLSVPENSDSSQKTDVRAFGEKLLHEFGYHKSPAPKPSSGFEVFEDWESDDVDELDYDGSEDEYVPHSDPLGGPDNASASQISLAAYQHAIKSMPVQNQTSEQTPSKDTAVSNQTHRPVVRFDNIERAPSPSDAALAKKASATEATSDNVAPAKAAVEFDVYPRYPTLDSSRYGSDSPLELHTVHLPHGPIGNRVRPWQDKAGARDTAHTEPGEPIGLERVDNACQAEKMLDDCLGLNREDEQDRFEIQRVNEQKHEDQWQRGKLRNLSNMDFSYRPPPVPKPLSDGPQRSIDFFEKPDDHFKQYDYGPFSTRVSYENNASPFHHTYMPPSSYYPPFHGNAPHDRQRPTNSIYHGYTSNSLDLDTTRCWSPYPSTQDAPRYDTTNNYSSIHTRHAPVPSSPLRLYNDSASKLDETQPSRLPIADLLTPTLGNKSNGLKGENVESVPTLSTSRNLKRKADQLEEDVAVVEDSINNAIPLTPESQGSELPDAQPREELSASAETIITQTSQDTFVLEGKGSTQSQLQALAAQEIAGPARKKAKIQTSKTGGIAKFVGGVCVGVVGVVAAFVATIPDSVREEAMREVSKLS